MSRLDTSKRQLSSTSSSKKHDKSKGKMFVTPNKYASLSVDSHPEVFSPPPVAEAPSHQGLDSDTPATLQSNSNRSPPMFMKNQNPFNSIKLRNVLSPFVGLEGFSFKSSKDFVLINTADYAIP
jgi:hypothetical protein